MGMAEQGRYKAVTQAKAALNSRHSGTGMMPCSRLMLLMILLATATVSHAEPNVTGAVSSNISNISNTTDHELSSNSNTTAHELSSNSNTTDHELSSNISKISNTPDNQLNVTNSSNISNNTNRHNATDTTIQDLPSIPTSAKGTFIYLGMKLSDMTLKKFGAYRNSYREAVASVAGVDVASVVIASTTEMRAQRDKEHDNDEEQRMHTRVSLRESGSLVVGTRVFVAAGQNVRVVGSKLTETALKASLASQGISAVLHRWPTVGEAGVEAVPCGVPTHTCTLAPTALVIGPPAQVNASGPRAEPSLTDLGPCVCDLTWRSCDVNCQCDAEGRDCSASELASFTSDYGVDYVRDASSDEVPMCFSKDTFLKLNTEMRIENSPLCIHKNNNPTTGRFFKDAAPSVSNDKVRVEFTREASQASTEVEAGAQPVGSYKVGMRIPVAYGATAVERFGSVGSEMGYLTLPHPGANGRCQFGTEVQYWKDAEGVACVQAGSVADLCKPASVLAADRLVKDLFVAKQVGGKEEWSNIAKWTPVTLQVQIVKRSALGDVMDVFTPASGTLPTPLYDVVLGGCDNVLESLDLTVVMDGNGGISSVLAAATLSHAATTAAEEVEVLQRFSARFVDANMLKLAGPAPLLQAEYKKSGNPGYVDGLPVRAGLATNASADATVMRPLRGGLSLPLMATPDGACRICVTAGCEVQASGTGGFDDGSPRVPVLFNQDLSLGCRLKLTRQQLADLCNAQTMHRFLVLPAALRLGIWGNADAGNANEWLPNSDAQPQLADTSLNQASKQAWDPRGSCKNVVDSMHLQILTARMGNVKNPQQKIIGARIAYGSSTWLAPQETAERYYSIRIGVFFRQLPDGASVENLPPVPSILPVLPDDIFYPFATGAGVSSKHAGFGVTTPYLALVTASISLVLSLR